MNQNCETCGNPKKFIPAGISKKTGNRYESFFVCEVCKPKRAVQKDSDQGEEILLAIDTIRNEIKELNDRFTKLGIWLQGEFDKLKK